MDKPFSRANPFPKVTDPICRLPLPTLFHSTRGYSPWRPAAVMSTTRQGASGNGFFKDCHCKPNTLGKYTLRTHSLVRQSTCFPSQLDILKKKRNLFSATVPMSPISSMSPPDTLSWFRNINRIPFRTRDKLPHSIHSSVLSID